MSTTEPVLATWRESLARAEAEQAAPLSYEEVSLELKGLGALILSGLGLLLGCAVFLLLSLSYVVGGERTTGVVIGFRSGMSRHGEMYAPVVAYVVDGREYRVPKVSSSTLNLYDENQEVVVLYMPDDPADSQINDFPQLYLLPTILGGLGTVLLTAAGGLGAYVIRKAGWRILPRLN